MMIRTIPRFEFERLLPQNSLIEHLMVDQVEWFANASGNLLGIIAKGKSVAGWNYVILKRNKEGNLHVHKVMNSYFSRKAATDDLLISMAEMAIEQPDLAVPLGRD
jgi:hypothetical protein